MWLIRNQLIFWTYLVFHVRSRIILVWKSLSEPKLRRVQFTIWNHIISIGLVVCGIQIILYFRFFLIKFSLRRPAMQSSYIILASFLVSVPNLFNSEDKIIIWSVCSSFRKFHVLKVWQQKDLDEGMLFPCVENQYMNCLNFRKLEVKFQKHKLLSIPSRMITEYKKW